jgi:hypothetical protein
MSVGAPEKPQAPAGRPPEVQPPGTRAGGPTRSNRLVALIVALIAGVVVGYLLRWGTEPTETATETLPTTVTETAAPEAYTTSDEVRVRLAFDGTACRYTGPAELRAGSTVAVKYTSTVEDPGWFIWWLHPGTTYEELMRADEWVGFRDPPSFVSGYSFTSGFGGGFGGSNPYTRISEGNLISIGCRGEGTDVFHATMLRVLGR